MTHGLVSNILLDSEIVDAMNGDSSVECLPNSILSDIRLVDCTNHMEMNWISSKFEGLSNIVQLDSFNSCD